MSYPSTVDTGQVQPFSLIPDSAMSTGGASVIAAGSAYLAGIVVTAPVTVTQMRCGFTGSPTGNVDMGIYDATGTNGAPHTLLAHTGAIAAVTGLFTQNLTSPLTLSPGRYWLAWLDTVTDTVYNRGAGLPGSPVVMRTTVTNLTVLPSTVGTLVNNAIIVTMSALLLGSFS